MRGTLRRKRKETTGKGKRKERLNKERKVQIRDKGKGTFSKIVEVREQNPSSGTKEKRRFVVQGKEKKWSATRPVGDQRRNRSICNGRMTDTLNRKERLQRKRLSGWKKRTLLSRGGGPGSAGRGMGTAESPVVGPACNQP